MTSIAHHLPAAGFVAAPARFDDQHLHERTRVR